MTRYTNIVLFVLIFCMMPNPSNAWFSLSDPPPQSGFTSKSSELEISSKVYGLHYNDSQVSEDKERPGISQDSGVTGGVIPVRISIDIPLSLLSKEAIDLEESLDRLLAANLRIQNILDEYLALQKRNELLLKDLRIPYLEKREKNGAAPAPEITGNIHGGEKLKTDMENMIRYGIGHNSSTGGPVDLFADAGQVLRSGGGGEISRQEYSDAPTPTADSENYQRLPGQTTGKVSDNEIPWIFRSVLDLFGYIMNNKVGLLVWSMVGFISILIVTLVVKR